MDEIKRYRLLIGGVVLATMVGLTWWAVSTKTGETPAAETNTPTLPTIDRDAITELEIRRPEDDGPIRLVREGSTWRLTAPMQATAARTAIDTALDKLADLEVTGVTATRAQNHERLEVDAAHGVRVTARAGQETVIDFWIGAFRGGKTMVRLEGQDQVLAVRGSIKFAFNKAVRDWRDRAIVELDSNEVREATFTNANGTFRFRKNDSAWEQVLEAAVEGEPEPAGIERYSATRVGTSVTSLARLRASDFAAADVTAESAGIDESAARVTLVSGEGDDAQTVTLVVGNEIEDGNRYVTREGDATIYVVSRFMAERLIPAVAAFQEPEPGEAGDEPPGGMPGGMPPGMGGMPPGMGGMGGMPGGGQIPPELMQQIQRQLQEQGLGGAGGDDDHDGHGH